MTIHAYGGDLWCSALALAVWAQEGIDARCSHLDTTSVALTGDDGPDRDEHAMAITPGDSKVHRPDLKQAVLERMVSQDGGGAMDGKSWAGHASDTQIFQERAQALMATWRESPNRRYLVADAKRSTAEKAPHLAKLGCITRMPGPLKLGTQVSTQALPWDTWQSLQARTRDQRLALCHDSMAQRWLVVCSQAALERAAASVNNAGQRAAEAITQHRVHLHAQRVETPTQAQEAWRDGPAPWRDHQVESSELLDHKRDGQKGRPTAAPPRRALQWQMPRAGETRGHAHRGRPATDRGRGAGDQHRDGAAQRRGGARRRQSAIPGRGWVPMSQRPMVFWLVGVCEKTLPHAGAIDGDDPGAAGLGGGAPPAAPSMSPSTRNEPESHQPPDEPSDAEVGVARVDGIARVRVTVDGQVRDLITGLKAVKIHILHLFGEQVCHVYHLPSGEEASMATGARAIPDNVQRPCSMSVLEPLAGISHVPSCRGPYRYFLNGGQLCSETS